MRDPGQRHAANAVNIQKPNIRMHMNAYKYVRMKFINKI